jgi:hypothetical protein
MRKMQEKSKIYNIQGKPPTPHQNKSYGWQTSNSKLKGVATKNTRFLNAKDYTPPKTKVNQIKRQTQQKTLTPPK